MSRKAKSMSALPEELVNALEETTKEYNDAVQRLEDVKAEIKKYMQDNGKTCVSCGTSTIRFYQTRVMRLLDQKALRNEQPEIWKRYVVAKPLAPFIVISSNTK